MHVKTQFRRTYAYNYSLNLSFANSCGSQGPAWEHPLTLAFSAYLCYYYQVFK